MKILLRKLSRYFCLASVLALAPTLRADVINVSGNLTGTNVWRSTNEYILNGYVYVLTNSVLRIEAGTVVRGTSGAPPSFGVLFITQGAKLFAEGTPTRPIIFTSESDDLQDPEDLPFPSRGLWGGIVLLGRSPINNAVVAAGDAATPKYDVYEGLGDTIVDGQGINRFGGDDPEDNSGVLRYVSIRHGGALLESNKEINGLSLGAVGRGTTIEYVEAYCTADDGFEFFGGTVNTRYLVSAFNDDDGFDADQGYTGKNQFWFGIQEDGKRDEGAELNGRPNDNPAEPGVPVSRFEVYNATLIGAGAGGGSGNDSFTVRQFTQTQWYNGIYTEFNGQPFNSGAFLTGAQPTFADNIWWDYSKPVWTPESVFADPASNSTNVNPAIRAISRSPNGGLDPRLSPGSPALGSPRSAPTDGFYQPVNYYGAFGANNLWIQGWTALSAEGFLAPRTNIVVVTNQYLTGEINWNATNIYVLTNYVYLMTNSVLRIEPGTVVKGRNGAPPNFGTLFVTRGAKIYAEGTQNQPIIFTAESDDLQDPEDLPFPSRGLWGGIVLLGRSPINNAVVAAGDAATPKYDVYEGLGDTIVDGQGINRFGGDDPEDNSGVLRYVSIRHGGALLESNKEINGLSLGAVGRGTTMEYVEAYCTADDGFEFFGGTVNTRYLVSAFNDDDGFDAD
ncbi:MAG TPA: T9SS C-terminal target domain-containing protein, partial [Verrucomicrobiales bacterium]|nr:T9SS C-terminal target domain-containing protein [Verrucomicrobiales bacterium]